MQHDVEIDFVEAPHTLACSHSESSAFEAPSGKQAQKELSSDCSPRGIHGMCTHTDQVEAAQGSKSIDIDVFSNREEMQSEVETAAPRTLPIIEEKASLDAERAASNAVTKLGTSDGIALCGKPLLDSGRGETCCEGAAAGACTDAGDDSRSRSELKDGARPPKAAGRRHKYAWFYEPGVSHADAGVH